MTHPTLIQGAPASECPDFFDKTNLSEAACSYRQVEKPLKFRDNRKRSLLFG